MRKRKKVRRKSEGKEMQRKWRRRKERESVEVDACKGVGVRGGGGGGGEKGGRNNQNMMK